MIYSNKDEKENRGVCSLVMKYNKALKTMTYINKTYDSNNFLYIINRAGVGPVKENFYINRDHLYPYCNLHFVQSGSGIIKYKGKEFPVVKGQIFILNAFEPHIYMSNKTESFRLAWLEFSGGDSIEIVKCIMECSSPIISPSISSKTMENVNQLLDLVSNKDDENKYLISGLIYSMLINLFTLCKKTEDEVQCVNQDGINKILDYIDKNIGTNLQINTLAQVAGFNADYFAKLFKKKTGYSPAKYIYKRRIIKAKELLSESDVKIEIISGKLGFCDCSHFNNRFKKAEGLTPAEFRKQVKKYL